MTSEEYSNAIHDILISGRGYKAIADLISYLDNMNKNALAVMKEMNSERKAIKKICESDSSNKEKVQTVLAMMR